MLKNKYLLCDINAFFFFKLRTNQCIFGGCVCLTTCMIVGAYACVYVCLCKCLSMCVWAFEWMCVKERVREKLDTCTFYFFERAVQVDKDTINGSHRE